MPYSEPFKSADDAYLQTVSRVLSTGDDRGDRTGTGTRSVFGHNVEIDVSDNSLAVVSLKKTNYRDAIAEMIWMLSGSNSLVPLIEQGIHIWTDWPLKAFKNESGEDITRTEFENRILGDQSFAEKWGTIFPCYGTEMRAFQSLHAKPLDQMQMLVDEIKANPESRRLVWSLWRPEYINIRTGNGLPPCHFSGGVSIRNGKINLKARIRSNDVGLGTPYNYAQYSYLLSLLCVITGYSQGNLIIDVDDCHIYSNHIDGISAILEREVRPNPKIVWSRKPASLDDNLSLNDFEVIGYDPQPFIPLPVAV